MLFNLDRKVENHFDEKKYGPVAKVWNFPDGADPHRVNGSRHYPFLTYSPLSNISVSSPDLGNEGANFYASCIHRNRFVKLSDSKEEKAALVKMALDGKVTLPQTTMFNEQDFMFMEKVDVLAKVRDSIQNSTAVIVDKQTREELPTHYDKKQMALDYLLGSFCFYRVPASDYTAHVNARITLREKQTEQGVVKTYIFEKGFSDANKGRDNEYQVVNLGVEKRIIQISDSDILNNVKSEKISQQNTVPLKTKIGFLIGSVAIAGVAIGGIMYSTSSPQEIQWIKNIDSCGSDVRFYVDAKRKTADVSMADSSKAGSLYLVNNQGTWSVDWKQTAKINSEEFVLGMAENAHDTGNEIVDTILHIKSASDCKNDAIKEVVRKVGEK